MNDHWRSISQNKSSALPIGGYGINGGISPLLQHGYLIDGEFQRTEQNRPAYFGEMQGHGAELEASLEKDSRDARKDFFPPGLSCHTQSVPIPSQHSSMPVQPFPVFDQTIPKLDLPSQFTIEIPETYVQQEKDSQSPYTVFNIFVHSNLRNWKVLRRYRQFSSLHENLCRKLPMTQNKLPSLPGKRVFGDSMDRRFVEERRQSLQLYLQQLVKIELVWKIEDFINFLDDSSAFLSMQVQFAALVDYVKILENLCVQMHSHFELNQATLTTQATTLEQLQYRVLSLEAERSSEGRTIERAPCSRAIQHSVSEGVLGGSSHPPRHNKSLSSRVIQQQGCLATQSPGMSLFSTWNLSRTPSNAITIPLSGVDDPDEENDPQPTGFNCTPSSGIFRNFFSPASPPMGMSGPGPGLEHMMSGYLQVGMQGADGYGGEIHPVLSVSLPMPPPAQLRTQAELIPLEAEVLSLEDIASAALGPLEKRAEQLLRLIAPSPQSHVYRASVFSFISQQVRRTLGAQCFAVSAYACRTYLPDEDVAVSAFLCRGQEQTWFIRLNEALCKLSNETQYGQWACSVTPTPLSASGNTESSLANSPEAPQGMGKDGVLGQDGNALPSGPFFNHVLSNVNFVNSRDGNQQIKCLVDNVSVDVEANQLGNLTLVAFLEEADQRIQSSSGCPHLFKKSLLLIKAWWLYETRPMTASCATTLLDSNALAVMVLALLSSPPVLATALCEQGSPFGNEDRLGSSTPICWTSPIQVVMAFFSIYARFPWDRYCVTIDGPQPLPVSHIQSSPNTSGPRNGFWEVEQSFISRRVLPLEMMEKYKPVFGLVPCGHQTSEEEGSGSSSPLPGNREDAAPHIPVLQPQASGDSLSLALGRANSEGSTASKDSFPVRAMNVRHPLDPNVNMVDEGMNKRKATRAASLFQAGAKALNFALASLNEERGGGMDGQDGTHHHLQSLQQLDTFFTLTWARFGQGWRPDAPFPSVDLSTFKNLPNQQLHEGPANFLSHGTSTPLNSKIGVMKGHLDILWENLKYCSFLLESEVTDSALRTLTKEILGDKGPLPVGEIGKLLQEATSNATLSTTLKDQFGGLKKFLEKYPDDFLISIDHPFNPHVYLKSVLTEEEVQQIMNGELTPATSNKKNKKAARRSKKTGNEKDDKPSGGREEKTGGSGMGDGSHLPAGSLAAAGGLGVGNSGAPCEWAASTHGRASISGGGSSLHKQPQQLLQPMRILSLGGSNGQVHQLASDQAHFSAPGMGMGTHPHLMQGGGYGGNVPSENQLSMGYAGASAAVSQSQQQQQLYNIAVGTQIQAVQSVGVGTNVTQLFRLVCHPPQQQHQQHQQSLGHSVPSHFQSQNQAQPRGAAYQPNLNMAQSRFSGR